MKKFLGLLMGIILFSFSLDTFYESKAEAATASIGQQLLQPEEGWKRYDDSSTLIVKKEYETSVQSPAYGGSFSWIADGTNKPIEFTFYGTKLRLIARYYNGVYYGEKINLYIDDELKTTFSEKSPTSDVFQALVAEVSGLTNSIHRVKILLDPSSTDKGINLDAIDIDETGQLINSNETIIESLDLNKEALNLVVGSSEVLVTTILPENATNKVIQWTSSDPEIASVDSNGNVIGKKAGNVTITATTTDGSNLSSTAEVTVKEAEIDANRAILRLTTTTKDIHEYDLSITEIEQFMNWLDGREVGQGKPYYKFKLNVSTGNIVSRTEYIMYDKIVSFTVDEYK
ncbi:Ig-like domain-containing protein [Lysinibacillus sp. NPDC047702]|uniref:Ig-like domain-containing protein n=1 Tax=unclassified Lysinibacillus TaxID=2636778 RepID=UPI003CFCA275